MTPEQAAHAAADREDQQFVVTSAARGSLRRVMATRRDADGWRVLTLECGHTASVKGHWKMREMHCWPCEDLQAGRDGERPSNAPDRATASPAREDPKA